MLNTALDNRWILLLLTLLACTAVAAVALCAGAVLAAAVAWAYRAFEPVSE